MAFSFSLHARDLERRFEFAFEIIVEIFKSFNEVSAFGWFIWIVILEKDFCKHVTIHVNIDLALVARSRSNQDGFSFQEIHLLVQGPSPVKEFEEHGLVWVSTGDRANSAPNPKPIFFD
jgi:hypothetical protein